MTTIANLFEQSQLSLASYAVGLLPGMVGGGLDSPYIKALTDAGMSAKQAQEFATTYAVVAQSPESGIFDTGFSATIFRNTVSGAVSIAIRGSEPAVGAIYNDWLSADLGQIVEQGIAIDQGVAMYNWLQRIFAAPGQSVAQYVYVPAQADELSGQVTPEHILTATAQATSELYGQAEPMAVAGHSLGGHLAMMLSRLAPSWVSSVYTYNAPGFDLSQSFFDLLGEAVAGAPAVTGQLGTSWDPTVMNHVDVEGDLVHTIGSTPGDQEIIFSESTNQGPIDAHRIPAIADSLALYDLFARLDPALDDPTFGVGEITDVLKAVANDPAKSVETALDAIRRIVVGPSTSVTPAGDREQFYRNYYDLLGSAAFGDMAGNALLRPLIDESQSDLAVLANTTIADGRAYRYAVKELNPFALLNVAYSATGELELYIGRASTPAGMTAAYIEDRTKFLYWKILANTADVISQSDPSSAEDLRYVDQGTAYQVTVFGAQTGLPPLARARWFKFGADGTDVVQAGAFSDHLYAGSGTDFLSGEQGDDYLEGGAGVDVYQYGSRKSLGGDLSNDGADEIRDTDGKGIIRYSFTQKGLFSDALSSTVIGGLGIKIADDQWKSIDGKFTYSRHFDGALGASINGDAGGSVRILGFDFAAAGQQGYLGIRLRDVPSAPITTRTVSGDFWRRSIQIPTSRAFKRRPTIWGTSF